MLKSLAQLSAYSAIIFQDFPFGIPEGNHFISVSLSTYHEKSSLSNICTIYETCFFQNCTSPSSL